MSAKLYPHGEAKNGSKLPEELQLVPVNDTPAYIYRGLEILEVIGLSPKSDPWRAAAICIFECILLFLPSLAAGFHLGNLRYAAIFLFGSIANSCFFMNIPLMVRAAPDLSPWLHTPRHVPRWRKAEAPKRGGCLCLAR